MTPVAVSASRWRHPRRPTPSPWFYTVFVEGPRGGFYSVSLIEREGAGAPHVFAVKRFGRCVGRGPARDAVERAAVEALS